MSEHVIIDSHHEVADLEKLAVIMDSKFTIPGTDIKFGLDPVLGLIPGIGDTLTLTTNAYIMMRARSFDIPWHGYVRMFWNIFIDWLIGLIPLVGDIFDIGFKSHRKNIEIIKHYAK